VADGERTETLGPRWMDAPAGRPGELEAIGLLAASATPPTFSAVSQQRVWRRLTAGPAARGWRPALILGLALLAGAVFASSVAVIRSLTRTVPPRLPTPALAHGLATPVRPAAPPLVIRAADLPVPAKESVPPKSRTRRPHLARAAVAVKNAPADEGTLGKETTLFREALALRAARDPRAAIVVLDRYAALYPRGSYAAEVVVLQGELAADAGDCAAAIVSFDRALASPGSPGLEERALYGRASCRQRSGDLSAARAELQRYLARFPHGKFAAHARATLDR
jgi:hypothetical protein